MSKRLQMLEKLTSSPQADSFAWYALALEYRTTERFDDALRTFERLREHDPSYVPMYLMAGQILCEQHKPAEASAWLKQGMEQARAKGDSHALGELQALWEENEAKR